MNFDDISSTIYFLGELPSQLGPIHVIVHKGIKFQCYFYSPAGEERR